MINIYIIKSDHLPVRSKSIDVTVNKLRNLMSALNIKSNAIIIKSPTIQEIENNINEYNNSIDLTEEFEDEDFKKLQSKFNLAQLSNLLKHKTAYELIKKSNNKHNLIIEDDVLLPEDYITNFNDCLKLLNNIEYDILFTCISNNNQKAKRLDIELSTINFKVLLTKSSYFITSTMASKLFDYLKIIRLTIKNSLSKFIYDNRDEIQSYILNKHTLLEGSKFGIFSSTVNPSNVQIQNGNYADMIEIYNKFESDHSLFNSGLEHYNKYGKNNPEYEHLIGLMYYKLNNYNKALEHLKEAVLSFKKKEGHVPVFNEILNNCINMHKYCQNDINNCFDKPSIYCA
jgi:GR25 family glycosyltransferase involved in LPS biosynthesis